MTHVDAMRRRKQIAEAVRGGMSGPQATRQFHVSKEHVRQSCSEHEVQCSFASMLPKRTFCVLARLLAGETQLQAAREVGVSPQRANQIAQLARKCGIKLPSREARN